MAVVINGSGTVTGLPVGGLPDGTVDAGTLATDSVTAAKLKDDAIAVGDLPAGSVLQVVSTTKTTAFSTTSTSFATVTGLTASITPSSTSSKILVLVTLAYQGGESGTDTVWWTIKRGTTEIGNGSVGQGYPTLANASYTVNETANVLDSPSTTSATTYSVNVKTQNGYTTYVNRAKSRADTGSSSITVMEIAG